jgi:hypothetical protein
VKIKTARANVLAAENETSIGFDYQYPLVKHEGITWNCRLPPYSVTLVEFRE